MTHDASHEELLSRLLAGDVVESSPAVRAELESCARCRERWTALSGLARRIDELEREQRDVLVQVARRSRAPGSDGVAAALERLRTSAGPARTTEIPPASRSRWRWIVAMAACLALAFVLQHFVARRGSSGGDLLLGSSSIEAIAPLGAGSVFDHFEWRYAHPPGGRCEVVIADANGRELDRGGVFGNMWRPRADVTDGWPDEIRWRVIVYDAGGGTVASSPYFAARRSR